MLPDEPSPEALEALDELIRSEPPLGRAAQTILGLGREAANLPPEPALASLGFTSVLLSAPAGRHGALRDLQLRAVTALPRSRYLPPGVRAIVNQATPGSPRLWSNWITLYRPEAVLSVWAARVRAMVGEDPPGPALTGLWDPRSNASAYVAMAQDPYRQNGMGSWLLARGESVEGLLAFERSCAFALEDPAPLYLSAVRILRDGGFKLSGVPRSNARRMGLAIADRATSVTSSSGVFHSQVVDLALDLAGDSEGKEARAGWLEFARARQQRAKLGGPNDFEPAVLSFWRQVRLRTALGERGKALEALQALEGALKSGRLVVEPKDPWLPALRSVPRIQAFLDRQRKRTH